MAEPTFLTDGHTPNRNDTKWTILQKILGAEIDGGGGGGGGTDPLALHIANNLSDVASVASSQNNLGLGSGSDVTFKSLTLTQGVVAASDPVLEMTSTWNNVGVAFTGVQLNITDTASHADSITFAIAIGGTDVTKFGKTGGMHIGANTPSLYSATISNEIVAAFDTNAGDANNAAIVISLNNSATNAQSVFESFGTLAGRTTDWYVFDGTSLSEFYTTISPTEIQLKLIANNIEATILQPSAAATDTPYKLDTSVAHTSGNLLRVLNLGSERFRTAFDGQSIFTGSGGVTFTVNPDNGQIVRSVGGVELDADGLTLTTGTITTDINNLLGTVTWNAAGVTFTGWELSVTDTASAAASLLMDLRVGGSSKFSVQKDGSVLWGSSGVIFDPDLYASGVSWVVGGQPIGFFHDNGIVLAASEYLGWAPGTAFNVSPDTRIYRDAANTFAHRNGTTAQIVNIYNTFTTVATSGEWFAIDWASTANVCNLWTRKGSGAGTARNLGLGTDGTQRWSIHATTGLLAAAAGVELQLGNAAVAATPTPTHTLTIRDSTGTLYRIPCVV